jgi:hypothetical protein
VGRTSLQQARDIVRIRQRHKPRIIQPDTAPRVLQLVAHFVPLSRSGIA